HVRTDQQFPKCRVSEDEAEGADCLLQNFATVGDEQQPCLSVLAEVKALEIEGGDYRFPSSGGCYDKVPPPIVGISLGSQCIQNAFLKWMRCHVNQDKWNGKFVSCLVDRLAQQCGLRWVKRHELTAVPIRLELRDELF